MGRNIRIFLQALVLSFLGHVIFFSMFIVEDIEFDPRTRRVSLTILPRKWTGGIIETRTSSNPDIRNPKLVQLAEMMRRTASPNLQSRRRTVLWEEEAAERALELDMLSWLMWSFRREKADYGHLFANPGIFPAAGGYTGLDLGEIEKRIRNAVTDTGKEIIISFAGRRLLHAPLPEIPEDILAANPEPVKMKVSVTSSGFVHSAIPEEGAGKAGLTTIAAQAVRRWRFSPVDSLDDPASPEKVTWGWIIVPWTRKTETLPEEGPIEENGASKTKGDAPE